MIHSVPFDQIDIPSYTFDISKNALPSIVSPGCAVILTLSEAPFGKVEFVTNLMFLYGIVAAEGIFNTYVPLPPVQPISTMLLSAEYVEEPPADAVT